MEERSLAVYQDNQCIPTKGGLLLFARSAVHQLPQAHIQIMVSGPRRWIIEVLDLQDKDDDSTDDEEIISIAGDLWSQLEQTSNLLARVNRPFRLKGPISQDVYPYPPLALKELLTNLLAHRDYQIASPSILRIVPSEIRFENPGGLIDNVKKQLDSQDLQAAIVSATARGIKGYRNPVIADFFFSAGAMDKEGSGLPDVVREAANNLNDLKFGPTENNAAFIAIIRCRPEALEIDAATRTARATQGELRYSPNLLAVTQWPNEVWKCGVWKNDEKFTAQSTVAPPFAIYRDWLWTFTDPDDVCTRVLADLIVQEEIHSVSTRELLEDLASSIRVLPRILKMALTRYLEKLNLRVRDEGNRIRAYFPAFEGQSREVTYRGLYKQATRTVAKPVRSRTTGAIIYWEHKAIALRFELLGACWCLALIPCYVFTTDGDQTPVAPDRMGPLSTRRASHDYNPVVLHDLVFWSRVLAGGNESTFEIPLSVSPSVDDNAPACSHPCIALSALIPTMVFQEPADANMETAVEAEMSEVEMEELQNAIEALIEEESETGGSNDTESADR